MPVVVVAPNPPPLARRWPFLPAVLAVTFLACGGVELTAAGARVRDAPPEGTARCSFMATLVGRSPWGTESAMNDALNKAAQMGATDVVWVSVSGGGHATPLAMARAYRCPASQSP
jgi:hypothetical protein